MTPSPYRIPPHLERCIREVRGDVSENEIARATAELSGFFTSRRSARPTQYFDTPQRRAAYLSYFLVANFSKLHAVFDEMKPLLQSRLQRIIGESEPSAPPFRVLDLGAGPGTMTLAALDYLRGLPAVGEMEFVAADSNREILKLGSTLFQCFRRECGIPESRAKLRTVVFSLNEATARLGDAPFDVIVMANVWNEWIDAAEVSKHEQLELVRRLLNLLRDDGCLIWIEPALKETSRRLHHLHDAILEHLPAATVFAPCVHQRPCPCVAPENSKDWCHTEFSWTPSATITAMDRRIGNRKDALKFSYLVLRKDGKNVLDLRRPGVRAPEKSACWRVVSERITEKGKQRAFLCGALGRVQMTRLDRHASPANCAFEKLNRGEIVEVKDATPRETDWRIVEETEVKLI